MWLLLVDFYNKPLVPMPAHNPHPQSPIIYNHPCDKNLYHLKCRRTGLLRPTSGPTGGKRGAPMGARHKRKPPRGMHINHDDLAAMASGGAGVVMLKAMDRELDALQRQVSEYMA